MGRKNETGIKARCNHCNYIWLYGGSNPITSCPSCYWRVRIKEINFVYKNIMNEPNLDTSKFFDIIDNLCLTKIEKAKQEQIKQQNKKDKHEKYLEEQKELNKKNKYECLAHYSSGIPKCMYPGCNITDVELLTIDHVNGDGWKDRRKKLSGKRLYSYLIKHYFPKGYKVLCFNHNFLEAKQKGFFGRGKQEENPPMIIT